MSRLRACSRHSILTGNGALGKAGEKQEIDGQFKHTVNYSTSCFAVCNYSYAVRNNVNGAIYTVAGNTLNVGVCGGFGE